MSIAPIASPFHTDGGADQEPRVDRLVVGRGAVALGADDLISGDLDVLDLDRPGLVSPQSEGIPGRRVRLHVLTIDHEHRQVVVAGEVRAGRLHDVEVGKPARGRPRRLLADLVAAVGALGARRDRVPEVRAGLGVRVGEGADLAAVERADVAVDQLVGGAQHDRVDRAHVHHVAHRRRRTPVPRDRLAGHRVGDVVLAEAAVLGRDGQRQEAVLAEQLEVAAGELELVVGDLRVGAHLLLAQLDQQVAQLALAVGEQPVGIPFVAQTPEGLSTPCLVGHPLPPVFACTAPWTGQSGS